LENRKKRLQIGNKRLQLRFQRRDCLRLGEKMEKNKKANTEVGYPMGGKEIPTPKAGEVMTEVVKGQKKVLSEKKRTAKWY
jgi:hypothetical protein